MFARHFARVNLRQNLLHARGYSFRSSTRSVNRPANLVLALGAGAFIAGGLALSASQRQKIWLDAPIAEPEVRSESVDPESSIAFPTTLEVKGSPPLTLIGLGVRKVSFLRVKVYSVGFYADLQGIDINALRDKAFEAQVEYIIQNAACAVRIVPTRPTSYNHLRDAFIRALGARRAVARKDASLTPDEDDALEAPLQELKGIFPTTELKKHSPLVIYSAPASSSSSPRKLVLEGLGSIENTWMATQFFKTYFVGEGPSPPLIKNVKEGLNSRLSV